MYSVYSRSRFFWFFTETWGMQKINYGLAGRVGNA